MIFHSKLETVCYNKNNSPGAQTVRRGVARAGENHAWWRKLTGRFLYKRSSHSSGDKAAASLLFHDFQTAPAACQGELSTPLPNGFCSPSIINSEFCGKTGAANAHFFKNIFGTQQTGTQLGTDADRLGKKSGAGFYNYAKGKRGQDDPAFQEILQRCRKGQKDFSEEELTDRLFLPMLTEASRVLMEEIVRSPEDVDMGLILGTGFPPQRGGILRWADTVGLGRVLEKLSKYEQLGERFKPTEQMRELAQAGKGFYGG